MTPRVPLVCTPEEFVKAVRWAANFSMTDDGAARTPEVAALFADDGTEPDSLGYNPKRLAEGEADVEAGRIEDAKTFFQRLRDNLASGGDRPGNSMPAPTSAPPSDFRRELESLVNQHSRENKSDTPDFLLADYVLGCLEAFEHTTRARDAWHGFKPFGKDAAGAPPSVSAERPAEPLEYWVEMADRLWVYVFDFDLDGWTLSARHDAARWMEANLGRPHAAALAALRAENDRLREEAKERQAGLDAAMGRLRAYEQVLRDHDNTATPDVMRGLLDQFKSCREERDRLRAEVATLRAERVTQEKK